ncbi:hypothetical protein C5S39_06175 [Candidatus Methanophagaceae archaeon]|nr:hypothetical protein C5S39_06175 [Methanophagales archaeon]
MVLKSKLGIILSEIFLGYELLWILITTDARHSTCASCNLLADSRDIELPIQNSEEPYFLFFQGHSQLLFSVVVAQSHS